MFLLRAGYLYDHVYTLISIKVALGFGHWNTEYNAMLWLSDHETMALKDQSTIPKATFIEIGLSVYGYLNVNAFLCMPYIYRAVNSPG